ncbi:MAG: hypothetical protein QG626_303 [Patescibacteria group bacterium]|nr:hypothetical protein [Patescibacteria group bacterium]
MDPKLKDILKDLYTLDPSLEAQEAELLPVLEALLKLKPETPLDANFTAELRRKLLTPSSHSSSLAMSSPAFHKFAFAGLGGLITLLIAVPVTYKLSQSSTGLSDFSLSSLSGLPKITNLGQAAFGTLSSDASSANGALSERSSTTVGMGGGGTAASAVPAPTSDTKLMAPGMPIDPYYGDVIEYVYTYKGEALDLSGVSDAVYKKTGGLNIGNSGKDLTRDTFGPLNISAFKGAKLQTFNVKQDADNGYTIYVDPENGVISINGNQGLWGYSSGDYIPLTESDIMSNEDAIATTNKFLADYDIDTTGFGAPVVDDRGVVYALSQPVGMRYIPDTVNITYPLLLEGQPAYNGDGSAYGLFAMVNMRTKAVVSLTINVASTYDKSSYELERDSAEILNLASHGGLYYYPMEGVTKTVEIELGTPEVILTSHYTYTNNNSELLFIPALSFPVTKNSDTDPVYSDHIVIPLVQSVIDEARAQPPITIYNENVKMAE